MQVPFVSQTIFVVDDDAGVRDSLRCLLSTHDFAVECFSSARNFLDSDAWSREGCAIIDICMPGLDGLELQDALTMRNAALPIIIITGKGDVPLAVRALKSGACDFFQKPFDANDLVSSVRAALSLARSKSAQADASREAQAKLGRLTERERQILNLVIEGQANKMIARSLSISPRTVEIHRANIMQKMDANSVTELVHIVHRAG